MRRAPRSAHIADELGRKLSSSERRLARPRSMIECDTERLRGLLQRLTSALSEKTLSNDPRTRTVNEGSNDPSRCSPSSSLDKNGELCPTCGLDVRHNLTGPHLATRYGGGAHTLDRLIERGRVVMLGDKRGAVYALAHQVKRGRWQP